MKISLTLNGSIILKVKTVQTAEFREQFTRELTEFMLQWFTWSGKALPSFCGSVTWVVLEDYSQNLYVWIIKDQRVIKSLQYFLPFLVQKIKNLCDNTSTTPSQGIKHSLSSWI